MKIAIATIAFLGFAGAAYADQHAHNHGDHMVKTSTATGTTAGTAATTTGTTTTTATTATATTGTMNKTATGKTVTMAVTGMTCGSCVEKVTTEFKKSGFDTNVSLESKNVTVTLKDGQTITDAQMQTIVKKAGFTPGTIQK